MRRLAIMATSVAGAGLITVAGIGAASAATVSGNVGSSGIPRSVFNQERLDASAQVLNTTTSNIQAAKTNKSFGVLVTKADLTKKAYNKKLKSQLTSDLKTKGYSQDQIIIAMQHRTIVRLRHKNRMTSHK